MTRSSWISIARTAMTFVLVTMSACSSDDATTDAGLDGGPVDPLLDAALDAPSDGGARTDASTDDGGRPCTTDDDCLEDGHCVAELCAAWNDGEHADTCALPAEARVRRPELHCRAAIPAGDPFPNHADVQATPVVLDPDGAGGAPPLVVAPFTATVVSNYTEDLGILRVLRGDDCSQITTLGGVDLDGDGVVDWIVSSATPAVGDLDGDGSPEIVAYGADASTLAFAQTAGVWGLRWKAPVASGLLAPCSPSVHRCPLGWAGPVVRDLDGAPGAEIVRESVVLAGTGALLSAGAPGYSSRSQGLFAALGNVDGDGDPEMTNGQLVWAWSGGAWTSEPAFPGASPTAAGHAALVDLDGSPGDEVVVVRDDAVMAHRADGTFFMAPVAIPGGGGGPPAIADFDGDGFVEIAVAGMDQLTLFDPDCGATPRATGATCTPGICDHLGEPCPAGSFLAFVRRTQDHSSNVTGVAAADLDGDGSAEAVYGDECFTRVYDAVGNTLASVPRSSCTWYELSAVADATGDGVLDLVIGSNHACSSTGEGILCTGLDAAGADVADPGMRCAADADCPTGTCADGFCRCTSSAECCTAGDVTACETGSGIGCRPPLAGTPGTGDVCRAIHAVAPQGIEIWSAPTWATGRASWSEHAYVAGAEDADGAGLSVSQWLTRERSDVRTAAPGLAGALATFDATTRRGSATCVAGGAQLTTELCNRGALILPAGAGVEFVDGSTVACAASTTAPLAPGACAALECTWTGASATPRDLEVRVAPMARAQCFSGNDGSTLLAVACP